MALSNHCLLFAKTTGFKLEQDHVLIKFKYIILRYLHFTHCIHIDCLQIWHWISYCILVLLSIMLVNGLLTQYHAQNNHLKVLNRMQINKKILVDEIKGNKLSACI